MLYRALRTLCVTILHAAQHKLVAEAVLLSSPRRPPFAKHYPPKDILNCDGSNFSSSWHEFRVAVSNNARIGYPFDDSLLAVSKKIVLNWRERAYEGSSKYVKVVLLQEQVAILEDFCLLGFAAALFVLFRNGGNLDHLLTIHDVLGWAQWPLDFSESSDWPALWKVVPLHLEHAYARGNASWSINLDRWGEEHMLIEDALPGVKDVEVSLQQWLESVGDIPLPWNTYMPSDPTTCFRLRDHIVRIDKHLKILVVGHHMGSSMEPFTMLREALRVGVNAQIEVQFHGQRHPAPNIMCMEFGYCNTYQGLEQWFRRYESRYVGEYNWMSDHWGTVVDELADVVGGDAFMTSADIVICGGPAWFCAMFRGVLSVPMLLYFAWPIVPMVPQSMRAQLLWQIQAMGQTVTPPTVIVVANWILAAQFALQVRTSVPVQRPHGLYVNQTYAPVTAPNGFPRVLVSRFGQWARHSGVALLELIWAFVREERKQSKNNFPYELVFLSIRVRGTKPILHVSYSELSQFYACIFWPWDVMMMLFNELYTLTMPLLLPDKHWMYRCMLHAIRHTDMNWYHLRADSIAGVLPAAVSRAFPLPHTPWIHGESAMGLEAAAYWLELTDFIQFPCLGRFVSIPDMLEQIKLIEVAPVRNCMGLFNEQTLRESRSFYRSAALKLLSRRPQL